MNRRKLEAVVFDLEGTLVHRAGASPVERDLEGLRRACEVLGRGGLELPDFRTVASMVFLSLRDAAAGLVYGNCREMSIPALVREFVEKAFPGTPEALVASALEAWYEPTAASARAAPGAEQALDAALDLGLRIAVAGNSPWGGDFLELDLERAGIGGRAHVVIASADVGYRKPNLFLLEEALVRLGAEGRAAVHVGDSPREDVEAPQELGMIAWVVAPPGSVPRADRTLRSLFEFEATLRELQGR